MQTVHEAHAGPYAHYGGSLGDWLIVHEYWTCNDNALDRANHDAILDRLPPNSYRIQRSRVQVSGEIVRIVIDPHHPSAASIARDILAELEDYPILDDDLHSEYEYEDAEHVWSECFNDHERLEWLRDHQPLNPSLPLSFVLAAARGDASCASALDTSGSFRELAAP